MTLPLNLDKLCDYFDKQYVTQGTLGQFLDPGLKRLASCCFLSLGTLPLGALSHHIRALTNSRLAAMPIGNPSREAVGRKRDSWLLSSCSSPQLFELSQLRAQISWRKDKSSWPYPV